MTDRVVVGFLRRADFQRQVRDPVARARNIDRIYDRMREIAPSRTTAEWEELLLSIDVPHTAFAKLTEIAEQPHLKAVGMFPELDHPTEGKIMQARPPARFSESPAAIRRLHDDPALRTRLGEQARVDVQPYTQAAWAAGMSRALAAAGVSRTEPALP